MAADSDRSNSAAHDVSRRDFLRAGALTGVGVALGRFGFDPLPANATGHEPAPGLVPAPFAAPAIDVVRIGFVGVGGQGTSHWEIMLTIPGVELVAVCDTDVSHAARASAMAVAAGRKAPAEYTRGPRDFERMCAEVDCDLVFNATPWEFHVPICVAAMNNGKHAATEVPAAYTVDGCWELVETAERGRKHCVMMENCNYDRTELMWLNMVRQGVLGDVLHAEGAYNHDLRSIKFSVDGEGLWRRAHATKRNGNFYPTHGLGPIANCLDINRGDRMDYVTSMSGPSRGLRAWQREHLAADDARRAETYAQGDVNISLLKTVNGKTVVITHDTNLPRPYSRVNLVQGTKGIVMGYPDRVYIEGRSEKPHRWDPAEKWRAEFDHPLWRSAKIQKMDVGHGGMDFLEDYRLITCLRAGTPTDMNVYDAAAMSSLCALTERSNAMRSAPLDIPDFTRGKWKAMPAWPVVAA
jgi:predicted dehydrogenase